MSDQSWKTEPDRLDFEADGLPCVMRRNGVGVWCGYVGVDADHPLYGLPTNHPLKLPRQWFEGRRGLQGASALDLFSFAMTGSPTLEEECPICLAFQAHGGVNYANDRAPGDDEFSKWWWFGFDCGHAGDFLPNSPDVPELMDAMIDALPEKFRAGLRGAMKPPVYRDQQYVVSECQSLAAQLIAIIRVIEGETHERPDHRRN